MTRPAAKGKTLWPALVAAAALLLTAPQALASRTASSRADLLTSPALDQVPATAHALAPAYVPQGFPLHLDADPHPAAFALFDDLTPTPASERLEPEKLASGVESWVLTPNLQRLQIFVTDSRWCREFLGPIDSPNLYQAFGLDPMNLTDPYGFSIWGDLVEATKFIGGMYLGAAKHAVTSIPKTVEAVVSLVPTKAVDAYFAASAVVAGYQAHGIKGAARAYVGEVKQTVSDVVQMVPFVAAIREAQCVDQTIVRAGAFAGGMQAGELADRVRIEGATLLMVASSLRATPRAAAAEPVAVDLNEVSEGLKSQWKSVGPKSGFKPGTGGVLQDLFDAGGYTVRVRGRHHLMPRALGNRLPYGHKSLTDLFEFKHSVLQGELDAHLSGVTKTLADGTVVDMLPRAGNPGSVVQANFTLQERIAAVDAFYRRFMDGKFYPAFRMELNAARSAGKLH